MSTEFITTQEIKSRKWSFDKISGNEYGFLDESNPDDNNYLHVDIETLVQTNGSVYTSLDGLSYLASLVPDDEPVDDEPIGDRYNFFGVSRSNFIRK